jgi:hypothetical protein
MRKNAAQSARCPHGMNRALCVSDNAIRMKVRLKPVPEALSPTQEGASKMRTGIAGRFTHYLEQKHWESTQLEDDDYQLEVHPVHGSIEAGFTLWQRRTDGRLDLVTSGHTYEGALVTAENSALDLSDDILNRLDHLLGG